MLDGIVTVAGILQRLFHRSVHFFRRVILMQLKNVDKIPCPFVVSQAVAQDRQHRFVACRPTRTPLPDSPSTLKRLGPFGDQLKIMLGVDLPFAVAEQSRVIGNLFVVGINPVRSRYSEVQ